MKLKGVLFRPKSAIRGCFFKFKYERDIRFGREWVVGGVGLVVVGWGGGGGGVVVMGGGGGGGVGVVGVVGGGWGGGGGGGWFVFTDVSSKHDKKSLTSWN